MDATIIRHLSKDPVLDHIIKNTPPLVISPETDVYLSLLNSIASQQLSVKAAATIFGRFLNLFDNQYPAMHQLKNMEIEQLRAVGLSNSKAQYMRNVAAFFSENSALDWHEMPDEEVLKTMTQIKGVGQWTTEMILIFTLNRTDVLPLDDLGIRQKMQSLFAVPDAPKKELYQQLTAIAEPWRPYRSFACRYLWHWKDSKTV